MKTIIFITIALALTIVYPAGAVDTSVEPANKADLNDFGKWLYSQPNTDLDLCIERQEDSAPTWDDSVAVLIDIVRETIPRRTAWATSRIESGQTSGGKAITPEDRSKYAPELISFVVDTLREMEAAGVDEAARTQFRQAFWASSGDTLVRKRMAEAAIMAEANRLRPYLGSGGVDPTALSALTERIGRVEDGLTEANNEIDALETSVDRLANDLASHMAEPMDIAHPKRR